MKYNLAKIRTRSAYTPQEISALFRIDIKTVYRWIKEGLSLLDPIEPPKLVMGHKLKAFLQAKRQLKKVKLNPDEFYCLHCRKAVMSKLESQYSKRTGKTIGVFNREQKIIYANCKECGGSISRFF